MLCIYEAWEYKAKKKFHNYHFYYWYIMRLCLLLQGWITYFISLNSSVIANDIFMLQRRVEKDAFAHYARHSGFSNILLLHTTDIFCRYIMALVCYSKIFVTNLLHFTACVSLTLHFMVIHITVRFGNTFVKFYFRVIL